MLSKLNGYSAIYESEIAEFQFLTTKIGQNQFIKTVQSQV